MLCIACGASGASMLHVAVAGIEPFEVKMGAPVCGETECRDEALTNLRAQARTFESTVAATRLALSLGPIPRPRPAIVRPFGS